MQSNDLQTNGKGEGLGWAPQGLTIPTAWVGGAGFCSSKEWQRLSSTSLQLSHSSFPQRLTPVALSAL